MAAPKYHYPRLPRKKTFEQQATVDEIMEVVADQGRRQSLSRADYSAQKRIETGLRRQQRATSDSSSFDDSSSCTSLSDISTSPPPTRQSSVSSISDEGGNTKMFEFRSRPRTLPPLNRHRTHRPCRPTPPKFDYEEETEILDSASRLSRPMSAIGQRSRPQRGFTLWSRYWLQQTLKNWLKKILFNIYIHIYVYSVIWITFTAGEEAAKKWKATLRWWSRRQFFITIFS